jgi:hypothetical protein
VTGERPAVSPNEKGPTFPPTPPNHLSMPKGYAVRACVSIHIKAPTFVRANTSAGMLTPRATAATITHGLLACAANANAFIAAEPMSVPTIAGRANRETCRRSLSSESLRRKIMVNCTVINAAEICL